MTNRKTSRVRWQLLALLWVWAVLMFAVVDFFWNVSEFDAVRPRAEVYRSMRYAGHKLVGVPYHDGDFGDDYSEYEDLYDDWEWKLDVVDRELFPPAAEDHTSRRGTR